jgi:hypothetical protein
VVVVVVVVVVLVMMTNFLCEWSMAMVCFCEILQYRFV